LEQIALVSGVYISSFQLRLLYTVTVILRTSQLHTQL